MTYRALALPLMLSLGCAACDDGPTVGMLADFALKVDCPQQPSDQAMDAFEGKMFAAGFDVLDTARGARDKHVRYLYPLKIDALDKAGRQIALLSLSGIDTPRLDGSPFVIHVALYSRPPTRRDATLEMAVTSWITKELGCPVRDVARDDNGPAAVPMYDSVTANLKNLFAEAHQMGATSDALLEH